MARAQADMPEFDEAGFIREAADAGEIVLQRLPADLFTDALPRFRLLYIEAGSADAIEGDDARAYAAAFPRDGTYALARTAAPDQIITGMAITPEQAAHALWWHRHLWR